MVNISVVIPTYNPHTERLNKALNALRNQTLPLQHWQLIVIDNKSFKPVTGLIDISWHPNAQVVPEPEQGLTYARLKGFEYANGELIVMVDDDNILAPNYLQHVANIFAAHSQLGAIGGKSVPIFETTPPAWMSEFYGNLALRDLGSQTLIESWTHKYPTAAPIGAGMALRKEALQSYISFSKTLNISDRNGSSLASGGDNDMVLHIIKAGWRVGYFPQLMLQHIIPKSRMQRDYVGRLVNQTNRSWIKVLHQHGINPWKSISRFSVPLRKVTNWLTYKAWKGTDNYIRWQGACGTFDGLADIRA